MSYRLVIFDFDGTLADSAAWFRGVINGVAARYGFRPVSDEDFARLRGCDNRAVIRHLGVPGWKMPLIANHMRRLAARDADRIALFPPAVGLLRTLKARGVLLAVVTSNAEANVRRIMGPDGAALIDFFECGTSMFGKAAKFRRVLKRAGATPGEAICVGDEARDIEAAAAAGIASGAVTWGYATEALLRAQGPTHVFDSMEAIAAAVLRQPHAAV